MREKQQRSDFICHNNGALACHDLKELAQPSIIECGTCVLLRRLDVPKRKHNLLEYSYDKEAPHYTPMHGAYNDEFCDPTHINHFHGERDDTYILQQDVQLSRTKQGTRLRPVSELRMFSSLWCSEYNHRSRRVADIYRGIFKFGVFNAVQSECFDIVGYIYSLTCAH